VPLTIKNVKAFERDLEDEEGDHVNVETEEAESDHSGVVSSQESSEEAESIATESADSDVDWDLSIREASSKKLRDLKRERKAKKKEEKRRALRRKKGLPSESPSDESEQGLKQENDDIDEEMDGPLEICRRKCAEAKTDLLRRLMEAGGWSHA